jgi:hypothetical protein
LAPEFTTSGQEEAGKGLKIPVCGGSSLHATPFRQEAAVHWMPMMAFSSFPMARPIRKRVALSIMEARQKVLWSSSSRCPFFPL